MSSAGTGGFVTATKYSLTCDGTIVVNKQAIPNNRQASFNGEFAFCEWTDYYAVGTPFELGKTSLPHIVDRYFAPIIPASDLPGKPELSAVYNLARNNIVYTSVNDNPGTERILRYDFRCFGSVVNSDNTWKTIIDNRAITQARTHTFTGTLAQGETVTCQWRDKTTSYISPWSDGVFIQVNKELAPYMPHLIGQAVGPNSIIFNYIPNEVTIPNAPVTKYRILCNSQNDFGYKEIKKGLIRDLSTLSFIWSSAEPDTTYRCYWQDENKFGFSERSNNVVVTTTSSSGSITDNTCLLYTSPSPRDS